MAVTLKQVEAAPEAYPVLEGDFLSDGQALPAEAHAWIWQRIEAYTAHRFTPRQVIWTVEGCGEWAPPLVPAVLDLVEVWTAGAWVACTPEPSPWDGYELPQFGPYRITATVGGGDVPAAVMAAARRLADYCLYQADPAAGPQLWATSGTHRAEGENAAESSFQRSVVWIAKAMQHSGAADLLRPYRRA